MRHGVYSVAGGKGGVGKTTTTLNLATTLGEFGATVVVVELDLGMANIVDFLDLDYDLTTVPTLHDVLADETSVFEALRDEPAEFDLLPSGVTLEGFANVDVTRMEWVLEALRSTYDVILLDTGAGISQETVFPLKIADEVVLVTTPRSAAVRDTRKTRNLARSAGTDVRGVVFTRSGTGDASSPDELAQSLETELLGHVPHDDAIPVAQDAGVPVARHAPESAAAAAYREVVTRAFDVELASPDSEGPPTRSKPAADGTPSGESPAQSSVFTAASSSGGADGGRTTDARRRNGSGEEGETTAEGQSLTARARKFLERRISHSS